jgi:hypothetical protein
MIKRRSNELAVLRCSCAFYVRKKSPIELIILAQSWILPSIRSVESVDMAPQSLMKHVLKFFIHIRAWLSEQYGLLATITPDEKGHEIVEVKREWMQVFLAMISICSGRVDNLDKAEEILNELNYDSVLMYNEARDTISSKPLHELEHILPSETSLDTSHPANRNNRKHVCICNEATSDPSPDVQ